MPPPADYADTLSSSLQLMETSLMHSFFEDTFQKFASGLFGSWMETQLRCYDVIM